VHVPRQVQGRGYRQSERLEGHHRRDLSHEAGALAGRPARAWRHLVDHTTNFPSLRVSCRQPGMDCSSPPGVVGKGD
jgi:hypothetical protein